MSVSRLTSGEGCWRYVVFPGIVASRRVEVVFAVYRKSRRAPVRVAIVDPSAAAEAIVPPPREPFASTLPLSTGL
jgi:hypothetical protein